MSHTDRNAQLPSAVAAYIKASNQAEGAALLATFSDDALVNDIGRKFRGAAAIKAWADREIFGAEVTMDVMRVMDHQGDVIVTAKLDGTYDKTGLPDPLILTFDFTIRDDRITSLVISQDKGA